MLPEGSEPLRAAPGETGIFLERGFSVGPDTSEGDGEGGTSFSYQSDPTAPTSAEPFSPLSPA